MGEIQNIVFDMGAVLIYFSPDVFIERQGITGEDASLLKDVVFGGIEWIQTDRGSLSEEAAVQLFKGRLPERLHRAMEHIVCAWWEEFLLPVAGMADLVRDLKKAGYGIYLLSNANRHLHEYFPRIPGAECFDGLVVSADYCLLKPERAIYEKLTQVYGLDLSSCLFIGDTAINVESAVWAGMRGIVFHDDAARLRRDLREAGVAF